MSASSSTRRPATPQSNDTDPPNTSDRAQERVYKALVSSSPFDSDNPHEIHSWLYDFALTADSLNADASSWEAALRALLKGDARSVLNEARRLYRDDNEATPLYWHEHGFLERLVYTLDLDLSVPEVSLTRDDSIPLSHERKPPRLYFLLSYLLAAMGEDPAARRRKAIKRLFSFSAKPKETFNDFVRRARRTWREASLHTPGFEPSDFAAAALHTLSEPMLRQVRLHLVSLGENADAPSLAGLQRAAIELGPLTVSPARNDAVNAVVMPTATTAPSTDDPSLLDRIAALEAQIDASRPDRDTTWCFIHGTSTHSTEECSKARTRKNSRSRRNRNTSSSVNSTAGRTKPTKLVVINVGVGVGGPFKALIDPGSTATLVTSEVAAAAGVNPGPGQGTVLTGAFGNSSQVTKTKPFPVYLGIEDGSGFKAVLDGPLLSDQISYDLIIGLDTLDSWDYELRSTHGKRRLRLKGRTVRPANSDADCAIAHVQNDTVVQWGDIALSSEGRPIQDAVSSALADFPGLPATGDVPRATPLLQNDIILKPDARPKVIKPYRNAPSTARQAPGVRPQTRGPRGPRWIWSTRGTPRHRQRSHRRRHRPRRCRGRRRRNGIERRQRRSC